MKADVVVLALGIDKSIEHEGLDRTNITLPGLQSQFAMEIYKLNKPTVLVLTNGGPIAIDDVMGGADAIVETFNPAFGTPMLAKTLFGEENRWGKLPYTIYPANYVNEQSMSNYDMSVAPGRTYRYYTGKPLFKYGEGMSYTSFDLQCGCGDGKPGSKCATAPPIMFACTVKNTGAMAGDEVVEVFHQAGASIRSAANHPVPIKSLAEFARVRLDPSESTTISFTLPAEAFTLIDESGGDKLYSGERSIVFSRGNGVDVEIDVTL